MHIIVGLGNPGDRYQRTRHNLGFRVVDELVRRLQVELKGMMDYLVGETLFQGVEFLLAKPTTFMNLSGRAVRELVFQYASSPWELLVICDDVNLPLGKVRLRRRGSDGGHQGLASIIYYLGSGDFPRLRLGVGEPPPGTDLAWYVLEEFPPEEEPVVEETIRTAADVVLSFITEGIEEAMNRYNR